MYYSYQTSLFPIEYKMQQWFTLKDILMIKLILKCHNDKYIKDTIEKCIRLQLLATKEIKTLPSKLYFIIEQ